MPCSRSTSTPATGAAPAPRCATGDAVNVAAVRPAAQIRKSQWRMAAIIRGRNVASRRSVCWVLFGEAIEDVDQLGQTLAALLFALGDASRHTILHVMSEDTQADPVERGFGSRQLLKDFDAEPRLLHHSADPADLPLYPVEPGYETLLLRFIQHDSLTTYETPQARRARILKQGP